MKINVQQLGLRKIIFVKKKCPHWLTKTYEEYVHELVEFHEHIICRMCGREKVGGRW